MRYAEVAFDKHVQLVVGVLERVVLRENYRAAVLVTVFGLDEVVR